MIYIILPVHNRKNITEKFIKCLVKQSYQNFKLILIDDGSTDGTDEMVLRYLPNSEIIYGDGNLWWAGGLQKGYEWLKLKNLDNNDTILIINDDTIIDAFFLEKGTSLLQDTTKTFFLAKCYGLQSGKLRDQGISVDWKSLSFQQVGDKDEINCLSTRGLFCKAKDFLDLKGFFPRLLPHYFSDYEFTIRAKRNGYTLKCAKELNLKVDETTTGIKRKSFRPFKAFIVNHFSIRNPSNPIYFISFILLSSPWKWKLINIFQVLWKTVIVIVWAIISNLRVNSVIK